MSNLTSGSGVSFERPCPGPDPNGRDPGCGKPTASLIHMKSRGEFKTPGGKLIAVEFDVVDGELRNVVVTGDFFLYPEEALPVLTRALENSPASLDEASYAARIRTALDSRAELVGSSPEALAAAVVRALRDRAALERDDDG